MANVPDGLVLESREKLYLYPDRPLHTFFTGKKLALPDVFADENRQRNVPGVDGLSGSHVSGIDYDWQEYGHRF